MLWKRRANNADKAKKANKPVMPIMPIRPMVLISLIRPVRLPLIAQICLSACLLTACLFFKKIKQ